jgi:hypothetical protein
LANQPFELADVVLRSLFGQRRKSSSGDRIVLAMEP